MASTPARLELQINVYASLTTIIYTDQEDTWQWIVDRIPSTIFSTAKIYKIIRQHAPITLWFKAIWNKICIPRHSFVVWLFTLYKSPTKDRLINWGLQIDPICLLCCIQAESRNHILFECWYSLQIWSKIKQRLREPQLPNQWEDIINLLVNTYPNGAKRDLIILAWQTTTYEIWRERNRRLHSAASLTVEQVYTLIDRIIRNRTSSLRAKNPTTASEFLQLWFTTTILQPP